MIMPLDSTAILLAHALAPTPAQEWLGSAEVSRILGTDAPQSREDEVGSVVPLRLAVRGGAVIVNGVCEVEVYVDSLIDQIQSLYDLGNEEVRSFALSLAQDQSEIAASEMKDRKDRRL